MRDQPIPHVGGAANERVSADIGRGYDLSAAMICAVASTSGCHHITWQFAAAHFASA
jgi:hypothetical protein